MAFKLYSADLVTPSACALGTKWRGECYPRDNNDYYSLYVLTPYMGYMLTLRRRPGESAVHVKVRLATSEILSPGESV
jgi:hypothetical protein